MKRRNHKIISTFVVVMVVVGLTSCGSDDDSETGGSTNNGEPIKVGILGEYSGDASVFGEYMDNGLTVAEEELFPNGELEIVEGDTQCATDTGVAEAQRLVEREEVDVLIGTYCSAVALAVLDVVKQAGIPYITLAADTAILTEGDGFVFMPRPDTGTLSRSFAANVINEEQPSSVAVVYESAAAGQGTYDAVKEAVDSSIDVTGIPVELDLTDLRPVVESVEAASADFVLLAIREPGQARFGEALAESGYETTLGDTGWAFAPALLDVGGLNGKIQQTEYSPVGDVPEPMAAFTESYEAEFDEPPVAQTATTFEAIRILMDLYEDGSRDRESILDALGSYESDESVFGSMGFTDEGQWATPLLHYVTFDTNSKQFTYLKSAEGA